MNSLVSKLKTHVLVLKDLSDNSLIFLTEEGNCECCTGESINFEDAIKSFQYQIYCIRTDVGTHFSIDQQIGSLEIVAIYISPDMEIRIGFDNFTHITLDELTSCNNPSVDGSICTN